MGVTRPSKRGSPTRSRPGSEVSSPTIENGNYPYVAPQSYTPMSHTNMQSVPSIPNVNPNAFSYTPNQNPNIAGSYAPSINSQPYLPIPPRRGNRNRESMSTVSDVSDAGFPLYATAPRFQSGVPEAYVPEEEEDEQEPTDLYGALGAVPAIKRPTGTVIQRKVKLSNQGIFSIEHPVSNKYLNLCGEKDGREFTHLRYTACTVEPDHFPNPEFGYGLRPKLFQRNTELFIVMTMYNEDEVLFARTMAAVQKNIAYLCSDKCSRSWGPTGWTNIVVCIVADGRQKTNPAVLEMLSVMGVYTDGLARTFVNSKPVTAHLYEFTTQISINEDLEIRTHEHGIVPVQILLCIKEKNAKKINSHRWFFNGFGPILNPNVCVLLDVGTKPSGKSIFSLWREFDANPRLGGACGEIKADLGKHGKYLINPLVAAQNFEYKMSNILDKTLESMFGYITVLPGAFSAYRYAALQNSTLNSGPLASYFKGEDNSNNDTDVFNANMYLAEDRILCFEVVTKRNEKWLLKYVKDAKASTDVPDRLPELVSQRRRWLNGSFFATTYSVTNFWMFFRSSHSFIRKFFFMIQTLYNLANLIFSWFQIGNMYLTFFLMFNAINTSENDPFGGGGHIIFWVLNILYGMAIIVQVIIAFGNRPQATRGLYYSLYAINTINMTFLMYLTIRIIYESVPKNQEEWSNIQNSLTKSTNFRDICISLASTFGLYLLGSVLYLDPWHMLTSIVQYLLSTPVYINMFMVYAFCNLHDISWGTKGDNVRTLIGKDTKIKKGDKGAEVEVELPSDDPAELDSNFVKSYKMVMNKPQPEEPPKDHAQIVEDYFRTYRTRVVLLWMISNVALVYIFSQNFITKHIYSDVGGNISVYLSVLFWCVAGLSAIRFIGCISYLIAYYLKKSFRVVSRRKNFIPEERPDMSQRRTQIYN